MANEKRINQISTIQRALGIIEGVMLLAEPKVEQTLATAVSMIDEVINEVQKDGK
jgi:hypothetical protein